MKIIHTNQVLALLALLSQSSMVVEAKKTKERKTESTRPHNPFIPKKISTVKTPSSDPGVVTNVINGEDAPANEYPWYSRGLTPSGEWWGCGGTLITPEFVLTAAHCGYDLTSGFQIGALCDPYEDDDNCGQYMETRWASAVYDHPGWDTVKIINDFTLVQLSEQSTIEFAPPDEGDVSVNYVEDKPLWVIGLGADQHYGFGIKTYPDHVQHAEVPYVTNPVCNEVMKDYLGPGTHITDVELCAGPASLSDPVVGTCNGDSGGPIYDKESNTLVGVTSWGIQGFFGLLPPYCGETPSVYARIADQWDDWIKPTICNNHSDPKPCYCDDSCPDTDDSTGDDATGDDGVVTDDSTTCPSGEDLLTFTLTTDDYGQDITWAVAINSGGLSLYEGPFGKAAGEPYDDNETFVEELCLPNDNCYKFALNDFYGDGLCCEYGNGGYTLEWNGDLVKSSQFKNGEFEYTDFGAC